MRCVTGESVKLKDKIERTPFKEGRRVKFMSPEGWLCAENMSWRPEGVGEKVLR
jgi:hypothetical protein